MSESDNLRVGKWITKFADNGWMDHTCSECGFTYNLDIHVTLTAAVCPMCGAIMDTTKVHENPNKTVFEKVVLYLNSNAISELALMEIFNQCYSHAKYIEWVYPMSMLAKATEGWPIKDIVNATSMGEVRIDDPYVHFDGIGLNSIAESEFRSFMAEHVDDIATYVIKNSNDLGDSNIWLIITGVD